jgi:hypothetical protein
LTFVHAGKVQVHMLEAFREWQSRADAAARAQAEAQAAAAALVAALPEGVRFANVEGVVVMRNDGGRLVMEEVPYIGDAAATAARRVEGRS